MPSPVYVSPKPNPITGKPVTSPIPVPDWQPKSQRPSEPTPSTQPSPTRKSSGGGSGGGSQPTTTPSQQPTDKYGQPISIAPSKMIQKQPVQQQKEPPKFSNIDWGTTFRGGVPKEPNRVTAQTYASYKITQGLGYVSDKISTVVPEGWAKNVLFEKKYSFEPTYLVKGALFAPLMVSGQASLMRSIKAGDIVPESKTIFVGQSETISPTVTRTNVVSKTQTMGQTSTGISQSYAKQINERQSLGLSRGYTFLQTPKGMQVKQYGTVSKQFSFSDVYATKSNQNMVIAQKAEGFSSAASKGYTKEYGGIVQKRINLELVNQPIKVNKNIIPSNTFGVYKPVTQDKSIFAYAGTSEPRGFSTGAGADISEFNIKGFIIKSPQTTSEPVGFMSRSGLSTTTQKTISSQVGSMEQAGRTAIIKNLPSTNVQPISPISGFRTSQSAYYGTGQYEKTQAFGTPTFFKQSRDDKLFFNAPQSSIYSQPQSLAKKQKFIDVSPMDTKQIQFTQPVQRDYVNQWQPQIPKDIVTETPITKPRQITKEQPFTPQIDFDYGFTQKRFPLAPIPIPLDLSGDLSGRRIGKQRKKRVPSLYAAMMGITARKASASEITGITLRPILTGKSRRKR